VVDTVSRGAPREMLANVRQWTAVLNTALEAVLAARLREVRLAVGPVWAV
jgi:hypothetical protein